MEIDEQDEALGQGFDEAWDEEDVDIGVSDARISCRCTFYDDDGRVVPGNIAVSLPLQTLRDLCPSQSTQRQDAHDLDLHQSFKPCMELLSRLSNPNTQPDVFREWLTSVSIRDALRFRGFVKQDSSLVGGDILNQIDAHIAAKTASNAVLRSSVVRSSMMTSRDGDDGCAIPFHWVQEMTTTRSAFSEDPASADIEPRPGNKRGRGGQRASADTPHTLTECLAWIKRVRASS